MAHNWDSYRNHSDIERWVCIYPAYLNCKKSLAEGRKISKEKCVENPTYQEIRDILTNAGFKVGVENKFYPRECSKEPIFRGCIRVQLKNDDETPCNSSFTTRNSLLVFLGSSIPKLKTRQGKIVSGEQSIQQSAPSNSKKGKGKGRR